MICEEKFVKYDPDASKWTWDNLYDKTYRKEPYWQALRKATLSEVPAHLEFLCTQAPTHKGHMAMATETI